MLKDILLIFAGVNWSWVVLVCVASEKSEPLTNLLPGKLRSVDFCSSTVAGEWNMLENASTWGLLKLKHMHTTR